MTPNNEVLFWLGAVACLFLIELAILWFILPFAVFGIKPLLRQIVTEQRKTNDLLRNGFDGDDQAPHGR